MKNIKIREVKKEDVAAILKIYNYYVLNTAITFEYEVPTKEEYLERIYNITEKYPFLVAEKDGVIVGFCYATAFKGRAAYDWSVETTVYVDVNFKKMKIGNSLYKELEHCLIAQGILNLYACIATTENKSKYLTNDSMYFHERIGYRLNGVFKQCGYKYNEWFDMIWMEKHVGEHTNAVKDIIPFNQVRKEG